jgi:Zn-dependent peptidase ImmA (M78 family)
MLPNKEKLQEYIDILACIMRIQDWDIEVSLVSKNEIRGIFGEDAYGCNDINRSLKASRIYLNTEDCTDGEGTSGWYYTLIHELMHIVHDDTDDWVNEHISEDWRENYEPEMERIVNRLTRIFCSIYPLESLTEGEE